VVVAPEKLERPVDRFLWTYGDGVPTPLTRHLMHAARLRHQVRVFDDGKASGRLRGEFGALVDDLASQQAAWSDPSRLSIERDRLSASLTRSQAVAVALRAKMDAMRIAVGIIDHNMMQAVGMIAADVAVGPLSEDHQLAVWLHRRLDYEIAMLDAATENARRAASLLSGEVAAPPPAAPVPSLRGPVNGHTANGSRVRLVPSPSASPVSIPAPRLAEALVRRTGDAAAWVVILTALAVEYEAVRKYLAGPVRSRGERGTLYEMGELPAGTRSSWQVAIAQTGPGSAMAGVQLERAIRVFQPEIALFVGVAGGRKDVSFGDVVVADRIYDYESGKSELEGFFPRMSTYQPAYRLVQQARLVARESRWQQRILPCPQPPPKAFVKPIATGAKVVADDKSEIALLLDRNASDVLAVETEGHGFLEGAYLNPGVEALVIRGISDLLTGKDQAGDEHWQPIASHHAAAFAVELLDVLGRAT
jgi:nucleoside phosphorylase